LITTLHRRTRLAPRRRGRFALTALALAAGLLGLSTSAARAQGGSRITGTVVGEAGQPLPSVQVTIPSTALGAVTNDQGKYTITGVAPGTYTVRAQRIGYSPLTQRVVVTSGADAVGDFTLQVLAATLAPVTVGYTTETRRDVSGAVASVTGADIRDQKVATVEEAVRGRIPGVQVAASGEPGRAAQIIVRGQNGFGSPAPLYVVDGMYMAENPNLNPDDIESIDVLKDASAAAQYGAQASNGVVVIRTRRGHAGNNELQLHTYYGYQEVPKRLDMMNAQQWQALNLMAYQNAGFLPQDIPAGLKTPPTVNTDWQDAVFQKGAIQDYNLQMSGGSPTAGYLVSGGVLDQKGTIITTTFRRYSFRVNSDARSGRLSLGENLALSQGNQQGLNGYPLIDVVRMVPTIPIYDPANAGGYGYGSTANPTYGTNPVGELQAQTNTYRSNQVIGTGYGELEIFHNLRYRLNLGLNYNDSTTTNWRSIDQLRYLTPNPYASLSVTRPNLTSLLYENLLNFEDAYRNGDHRVTAVVGTTSQRLDYTRICAYRQGFTDETLRQIDAGSSSGLNNCGNTTPFRSNAVLGRLNYALFDRYLFSVSGRRDCSSRFSPNSRCGNFGAGSIGWVASDEHFFQSIPLVNRANFLKLRASTGVLGDQNIGEFAYLASISSNVNYIFNNNPVSGAIQQALANPNLRWQQNRSTDIGADLGVLGNALTLTADYYNNTSDHLLVSAPIPPDLGSSVNPTINAGKVRNAGFELGANHHLERGKLQFNTSFNLTSTRNKVLSLGNGGQPIFSGIGGVARSAVGFPIGEFYVKHVAGIFQSAAEVANYKGPNGQLIQPGAQPGDIKYADLNNDGTINDQDRYNAGNGIPKLTTGLFLDTRYGPFDAGINFRGSYGQKIFNVVKWWTERMDDLNNSRAGLQPWTQANPSTTTPRAVYGAAGAANGDVVSDRWIEKGSYTRLQNLIVGYTLPSRLSQRFYTGSTRVYLNIQNVYTWTKYSNWDPEILGFGDPLARGIDDGFIYPNPRTLTFGLDLRL
jgi:TonB-dependent starch-binding outer membrane protein SusC